MMKPTFILALALVAVQAGAQSPEPGPRWRTFSGCWNAVSNSTAWDSNSGPERTICVVPTPDLNVANVVTLVDGKVVSRDIIDASGRSRAVNADGCSGTEQGRFSSDERRVFLRSSVSCQGMHTETSSMLALSAGGDWVDVRSVTAGGNTNVRVARFRDAGIPRDVPSDVAAQLAGRGLGTEVARMAATEQLSAEDLVEASHLVDGGVLAAYVMESGHQFATDAAALSRLADAGVPTRVTDAMIEVSNTRVASRGRYDYAYPLDARYASPGWEQGTGSRVRVTIYPYYDPWGHFVLGYPYGFAAYGRPYHEPYYGGIGLGFGYGFGSGYGWGREVSSVGYFRPPVIVLHQGRGPNRGEARKGEGYHDPRTAAPIVIAGRPATNSGPPPAANPPAPEKGGSSSPRTAKPKGSR